MYNKGNYRFTNKLILLTINFLKYNIRDIEVHLYKEANVNCKLIIKLIKSRLKLS